MTGTARSAHGASLFLWILVGAAAAHGENAGWSRKLKVRMFWVRHGLSCDVVDLADAGECRKRVELPESCGNCFAIRPGKLPRRLRRAPDNSCPTVVEMLLR